jgi:hypothetical protein
VKEEFLRSGFYLTECSSPAPSPGKEWEEYTQIRALVEKIRKKQKGKIVGMTLLKEAGHRLVGSE